MLMNLMGVIIKEPIISSIINLKEATINKGLITTISNFNYLLIKVNSNCQKVNIVMGTIIIKDCIIDCIINTRGLVNN